MSTLQRVINDHIRDFEEQLYTSAPAIVQAYDPEECTVDVLLCVRKVQEDNVLIADGLLERVPLAFPSVSDSAITFPVQEGDKVTVFFSQDNTENFFLTEEDFVRPRTKRKHDVNDAFAVVGLRKYADTPVNNPDTLDFYFKNSRLTFQRDGTIDLEMVQADDADPPQETLKSVVQILPSGEVNIQYTNNDIDSQVNIADDGTISLLNNKEDSSFILQSDGNIAGVTANTFSMSNSSVELVDLLHQLATQVSAITTNTIYGPAPINNKAAVEAIISDIGTIKE